MITYWFMLIFLMPSGQEQRIEHKGYTSLAVCERVMGWEVEQAMQLWKPYRLDGIWTTRCEEVQS